jgi:hypothetical protein
MRLPLPYAAAEPVDNTSVYPERPAGVMDLPAQLLSARVQELTLHSTPCATCWIWSLVLERH